MSKTPYRDLSSEAILSAHISGLQHDINKVQEVLDMRTSSVTDHELKPVNDQEDASLRYRIYEGSIRNWLDNPTPNVYRNSSLVNPEEYIIEPAYGVVIFHEMQSPNDDITANFSHINSESNTIININNEINSLKENSGSGSLPDNYNILGGVEPFYMLSGSYISHQKRNYDPVIEGGYNTLSHSPGFNILVYGDTIDAFPCPIPTETTFKQAAIMLGNSSLNTDVNVRIGLYRDNGNLYPAELVFQSDTFTVSPGSWGYADIDVTIPAGLYWIARHDGGTARWNGLLERSVINLQKFDASVFLQDWAERPNPFATYGGYRATNIPFGEMPSTFPSGIEPFKRDSYCTPWLVVE